jgi:predicted DCC family thiol-disulfide oxidoreductase YuxK
VRVLLSLGAGGLALTLLPYLLLAMIGYSTHRAFRLGPEHVPLAAFVVLVTLYAAAGTERISAGLLLGSLLWMTLLASWLRPQLQGRWWRPTEMPATPPEADPSPLAVLLLVVLVVLAILIPPNPFGSWPARKRADPAGGWSLPRWWHLFAGASFVVYAASLGTLFSRDVGLRQFQRMAGGASDLVYGTLLALMLPSYWFFRRARPWIWLLMVAFVIASSWLAGWGAVLGFGLLFALLAFDPGWIRPRRAGTTDTLFYDGGCGLCHTSVRFILAEDRSGTAFRFAPIGGAAWREAFPDERAAPAQTLVIQTARGETLSRSTGALYIARRLGGFWRVFGTLGLLIPRPLRDLAYNALARVRHHMFRAPTAVCPLVPPEMRERFDLRPAA